MKIRYMSIFTKIENQPQINPRGRGSELKAFGVSVLVSVAFLFFFVAMYEPGKPVLPRPEFAPPAKFEEIKAPADPNEKYRLVPESFRHVDFENRSYGRYRFWEKKLNLMLTQGEKQYWSRDAGGETFSLEDVYYNDLTGDGRPEAFVILSHVQCGGSCDGGSHLLYVYANSKKGLKKIWEYETGSPAYGCGLKGLTLSKKNILLEMFGRCFQPATESGEERKFMIADTTYSLFTFNGSRFVKRQTEVIPEPARDVKNHTASIQVFDQ